MAETQNAMTPEEWERVGQWRPDWRALLIDRFAPDGREAHRAAALALFGQPFGFTRADVEALRDVSYCRYDDDGVRLAALADKIAALLPQP
jgi:hypothetical protein